VREGFSLHVGVKSCPAAVRALQVDDPLEPSLNRGLEALDERRVEAVEREEHGRRVVDVGVELVLELEVPAADRDAGDADLPISGLPHLFRHEPASYVDELTTLWRQPRFAQRVDRERGVPHRREAWL
jgi:hypothetical protein